MDKEPHSRQLRPNILLFGGTFNPIHHGHLRSALECQYLLGFDEVWFIPNAQQPLKSEPTVAAAHRLAMIELAIASYPAFRCIDIEIQRGELSYTVDTIAALQRQFPEVDFTWQLGQDALNKFDQWHRWKALLSLVNWVVVPRPGYQPIYSDTLAAELTNRAITADDFVRKDSAKDASADGRRCGNIVHISTTEMALSSTQIRQLANQSLSCDFLVPKSVSHYIATHALYG